jgi:hypothetical protein
LIGRKDGLWKIDLSFVPVAYDRAQRWKNNVFIICVLLLPLVSEFFCSIDGIDISTIGLEDLRSRIVSQLSGTQKNAELCADHC